MTFDVVVAHDLNRGIGINNALPWRCAPDMAHFKTLTTGKTDTLSTVIMGRNTWASLPEAFRPLPRRNNIVVSNTLSALPGALVAPSLDEALLLAKPSSNTFVIGGAQLYAEALAHEGVTRYMSQKYLNAVIVIRFFQTTLTVLNAPMRPIFGLHQPQIVRFFNLNHFNSAINDAKTWGCYIRFTPHVKFFYVPSILSINKHWGSPMEMN